MKIGIITYHRAHNYGAVLQAYALKKYLTDLGHHVEIIDYWPAYRKGIYDLIDLSFLKSKFTVAQKIRIIIKILIALPEKIIRYNRFRKFIKNYLEVKGKVPYRNGWQIPATFDGYIYGSDQIWRSFNIKTYKGFDPVYWGEFPHNNVKKMSYAASMGDMELSELQKNLIKTYLKNFNFISVREKQLYELIQPLTNKIVSHVLDPVFLLGDKKWLKICHQKPLIKHKYVLLYNLNYSENAKLVANKMAGSLKCKVIEISGTVLPLRNPNRNKQTIGPKKYIRLFADASFVVSTSFHGVAFSILFKKQFYALGFRNNAARVKSLLNLLGIENRYLTNIKKLFPDVLIDYKQVGFSLEKEKQQSFNFLKSLSDEISKPTAKYNLVD